MEDSRVAEYAACQLPYKNNHLQYQQATPLPQPTVLKYSSLQRKKIHQCLCSFVRQLFWNKVPRHHHLACH